jgi:hypothetical protein
MKTCNTVFAKVKAYSYRVILILVIFFAVASFSVVTIFAAPPGSQYNPAETLDPTCAPGALNCSVDAGIDPAGLDTYVQFNDSGSFGASSKFIFDEDVRFNVEGETVPGFINSVGFTPDITDDFFNFPTGSAGAYLSHFETASGDRAYVTASDISAFGGGTVGAGIAYVTGDLTHLTSISVDGNGLNLKYDNPTDVVDYDLTLDTDGLTFGNNNGDDYTFPTTDGTAGQFMQTDGNGVVTWSSAGTGNPSGDDREIQFNDSGTFGGVTNFTYDELGVPTTSVSETALSITQNVQPTSSISDYSATAFDSLVNWDNNDDGYDNSNGFLFGLRGGMRHNGSGLLSFPTGVIGEAFNQGSGSVINLVGVSGLVEQSGSGSVAQAIGTANSITNSGTGNITVASGYDIFMDDSGVGSISTGVGFRATQFNGGIHGSTAIGFLVENGALSGTFENYGIRIDDPDGENYFAGGLRVGNNASESKFDDGSNGASSTTMYIGNETIDTSVSDRRLKDNIQPASTSALDFLADFEVVEFDWLPENDRSQYGKVPFGLIAQEVDELAPQYTKKTDNPEDYMSVRFQDMVPALIGAVQELQSQITDRAAVLIDGVRDLVVRTLVADDIQARDELCVGDRCVTEDELGDLLDLLEDSSVQRSSSRAEHDDEQISHQAEDEESEEVIEEEDQSEEVTGVEEAEENIVEDENDEEMTEQEMIEDEESEEIIEEEAVEENNEEEIIEEAEEVTGATENE